MGDYVLGKGYENYDVDNFFSWLACEYGSKNDGTSFKGDHYYAIYIYIL